jgi:NDP-sugar pyrophosphorylase family protein
VKLPVAILAGGLATRLRPVTETIPKALVDVAGTPFILRQLDYLRHQGASRVVICVGYLGEQIEAVVGDGAACGLSVSYSQDWPSLLGTGGALKQALPALDSRFLVLYGDSYLPIDFAAVERAFLASGKPALMTVQHNADRWDKSNVLFRDGAILEYNKRTPTPDMVHIDYGLGAISADVLKSEQQTGPFDLADIYHRLSLSGDLAGYEVDKRFYEIGSHKGLAETAEYFKGQDKLISYAEQHLRESIEIIRKIDPAPIEKIADLLAQVKAEGGRIFFLGVGGSAGNCSHAVNDFRKIVGIESYAPTDNVSELTARTNDEGWATTFVEWLKISKLLAKDAIFIFSVGGGNLEKNISPNLVLALQHAKTVGAKIMGVVGRDGGYTAQVADAAVIVPTVNPENVTPHSEALQAVVWHLLVSHPKLKANQTKWEAAVGTASSAR